MKALTICQPYAELIVRGEKRVENRSWSTHYRGPLLIHAGVGHQFLSPGDRRKYPGMAFGAIVGVAELAECFAVTKVELPEVPGLRRFGLELPPSVLARWEWLRTHKHVEGPFCWLLEGVRRFRAPIPYRGRQGLFEVPDGVVAGAIVEEETGA